MAIARNYNQDFRPSSYTLTQAERKKRRLKKEYQDRRDRVVEDLTQVDFEDLPKQIILRKITTWYNKKIEQLSKKT